MKHHDEPFIIPAIERAAHAIAQWIDQTFRELRITQAEAHVLAYLSHHAPCAINDVHHHFGHKRSTLTSLLDRLERQGWILRVPHPTSRRSVQIELTERGRQIGERVNIAVQHLEEQLTAYIGNDDIATFLRVASTIQEVIFHERQR
jgi:DNA-binding MarR family transcriptional regulator